MSYTKAANELYITQPAVSQHIKSLEKHYGAKLFFYNGKKLILTEQGNCCGSSLNPYIMTSARIEDMVRHIHQACDSAGSDHVYRRFYLPEKAEPLHSRTSGYNVTLTIQDTVTS